jgi:PKD repeat protein
MLCFRWRTPRETEVKRLPVGKGIYAILTCLKPASLGGRGISPKKKLAIVAATTALALVVVVVGLASLEPKSKPQSVNELPVADFSYDADNLTVVFDASASGDPDGSIANYSWSLGDENAGFGMIVAHVYLQAGTFDVELTVTDDKGGKNTTSQTVSVTKTEPPPASEAEAIIEIVSKHGLKVELSGAKSEASDGADIVTYSWDFGDDATGTGVSVEHKYAASGIYTITLTVTDSKDVSASATVEVSVECDDNPPPPPPPPPPNDKVGPPGLYNAIEIHEEKADKNKGTQNSLDHLRWNLEGWIDKHVTST